MQKSVKYTHKRFARISRYFDPTSLTLVYNHINHDHEALMEHTVHCQCHNLIIASTVNHQCQCPIHSATLTFTPLVHIMKKKHACGA